MSVITKQHYNEMHLLNGIHADSNGLVEHVGQSSRTPVSKQQEMM